MTAEVLVRVSPPETITTDPSADLRTSIHETIAQFQGRPVRPSVVTANHKKSTKFALKTDNGIAPKKTDGMDVEALQSLLAALAFSPRDNTKKFGFASPRKVVKPSNATVSSSSTPMTPWEKQPRARQATPPTASSAMTMEEPPREEEDEDDVVETPTPLSPVRSYHSSSSHNPAAAAYVLALPKELTSDSSEVGSTLTSPSKTKRWPTVDTDIPGAGTVRSSICGRKGSAVKLPFVHISDLATHSPRRLRKKSKKGPAGELYQHTKIAWGWSKDHVGVLTPVMNFTETALCWTASLATGQDNLQAVDTHVVTPLVRAVDQHVVNPVVGFVGGIFGNDEA